jgi:hypothetical protein
MEISAIELKTWSKFRNPVQNDSPVMLPIFPWAHKVSLLPSYAPSQSLPLVMTVDIDTAGPRVRRSWTRERPPGPASPLYPQSPGLESIPPYAPEPPLSPTISHSTTASISTSNSGDHWATRVFSEDVGATALPRSGDALVSSLLVGRIQADILQIEMLWHGNTRC